MSRDGGRNNPDQPGYEVPYDPNDARDVGSGTDFGADLYALYRAGRVYFPETGILFSGWASSAHDFTQRVEFLSGSVGGEYALSLVDQIRADLHFALRQTATAMRDVGTALVQISTDYAQTDQGAMNEFNRLLGKHPGLFSNPTPNVPQPPGSDSPYETPYEGPSLEAPEPEPWWVTEWMKDKAGEALDPVEEGLGGVVDDLENWWQEKSR